MADVFWEQETLPSLTEISVSKSVSPEAVALPSEALFGSSGSVTKVEQKVEETKLNLSLKGVFPATAPDQGMAIIAARGQKDGLFQTGEEVSRGVVLAEVYSDRVLISRGAIKEALYFERPQNQDLFNAEVPTAAQPSTQSRPRQTESGVLPGSARSAYQAMSGSTAATSNRSGHPLINDINRLTVAQMIDTYEEKFKANPQALLASSGLEATGEAYRVTSGSPLIGIGLRAGDEILTVNGKRVGNVSADVELADTMRQQGVARIEMRRGDRRFFVNYPVR